jgi:hypothetical protein
MGTSLLWHVTSVDGFVDRPGAHVVSLSRRSIEAGSSSNHIREMENGGSRTSTVFPIYSVYLEVFVRQM